MADMLHVSEDTFKNEVLDSEQPVLVDFSAVWCQPCKMLDPVVKQLAGEWDGKVKVVKIADFGLVKFVREDVTAATMMLTVGS